MKKTVNGGSWWSPLGFQVEVLEGSVHKLDWFDIKILKIKLIQFYKKEGSNLWNYVLKLNEFK